MDRKGKAAHPATAASTPGQSGTAGNSGMRAKRWLPAIALAFMAPFLIVGFLFWQGGMFGHASGAQVLSPGMAARPLTLTAQDGRTFNIADYKGRAVFLAFVPSWSDAKTIAEVRSLAASIPQFDAAGAKVMVVSADDPARATALHDEQKLPFPLLLDTGGAMAKRYDVPPGDFRTTFVVSPAGLIKYRVSDAAVEPAQHGQQLLDVSKCCIDEVTAARAHGIGKAIGDFSLTRADNGAMGTLLGDGKQKATVALILSVKCPCSNAYNDRVAALAKSYAGKPVRIVGIYANQDETAADITHHARQHGFTFPIFKDEGAQCADHLGAGVTPEVFVLDAAQVLRYAGRIDDSRDPADVKSHDLSNAVDSLLAGQIPSHGDTRAFGCAIVRSASAGGIASR